LIVLPEQIPQITIFKKEVRNTKMMVRILICKLVADQMVDDFALPSEVLPEKRLCRTRFKPPPEPFQKPLKSPVSPLQ
jgi:hypothetical protein